MNNDRDKDKIRRALQRFDLIPSKRKTKAEQNRYNKIGTFIDTAKCTNSLLILKLCIKLIEDKNTICEEVSEDLDPMFVKIFNDYNKEEPMTREEIIISLHQSVRAHSADRSKVCEEKYNQRLEFEELIQEKNNRIKELTNELNDMTFKYNKSEQLRMEMIDKYDSDSEEEIEPINDCYQKDHTPLPVINYDTDDSDADINWKELQLKQELEFQKHNINI